MSAAALQEKSKGDNVRNDGDIVLLASRSVTVRIQHRWTADCVCSSSLTQLMFKYTSLGKSTAITCLTKPGQESCVSDPIRKDQLSGGKMKISEVASMCQFLQSVK